MYQEGLKLCEKYSKMADEQFTKLNGQDQDLCNTLRNSKPINHLINNDNYNSLINFKTIRKSHGIYFSFDILGGIEYYPGVLYKIIGSFVGSVNGRNIVYTIHNNKDNSLYGIYNDNYTLIKNNVILNEVTYINTRRNSSRVEHVSLTIIEFSKQNQEFIIDPDSDIYKLYCSKQIDATTLCNLALLQAHKQTKQDESLSFVKKLDKKFI